MNTQEERLFNALEQYLTTKPEAKAITNFGALCELTLGVVQTQHLQETEFNKDTQEKIFTMPAGNAYEILNTLINICECEGIEYKKDLP